MFAFRTIVQDRSLPLIVGSILMTSALIGSVGFATGAGLASSVRGSGQVKRAVIREASATRLASPLYCVCIRTGLWHLKTCPECQSVSKLSERPKGEMSWMK